MKKWLLIILFLFLSVPMVFAEIVTKQMYIDENNTMWVDVSVWRDGDKVYASFDPSEDISDVPFQEAFILACFVIEQSDVEYTEFGPFSFYDEENEIVFKIEDRYLKTQIKTAENSDIPDDMKYETDLDLNKAFLLKYNGGYHDYTMSISAASSGGGGGGGGGCFINILK